MAKKRQLTMAEKWAAWEREATYPKHRSPGLRVFRPTGPVERRGGGSFGVTIGPGELAGTVLQQPLRHAMRPQARAAMPRTAPTLPGAGGAAAAGAAVGAATAGFAGATAGTAVTPAPPPAQARPLTRKDKAWLWRQEQTQAFGRERMLFAAKLAKESRATISEAEQLVKANNMRAFAHLILRQDLKSFTPEQAEMMAGVQRLAKQALAGDAVAIKGLKHTYERDMLRFLKARVKGMIPPTRSEREQEAQKENAAKLKAQREIETSKTAAFTTLVKMAEGRVTDLAAEYKVTDDEGEKEAVRKEMKPARAEVRAARQALYVQQVRATLRLQAAAAQGGEPPADVRAEYVRLAELNQPGPPEPGAAEQAANAMMQEDGWEIGLPEKYPQ